MLEDNVSCAGHMIIAWQNFGDNLCRLLKGLTIAEQNQTKSKLMKNIKDK